ncbi:response regulator transcription factor [Paracidovorax citrulli]
MLQTYRQGALHTPNSAYGELSAAPPRKATGGAVADEAATGAKRGKEVCVVELEGRRCRLVRLGASPGNANDAGEIIQFEFEGCCYALFADPLPDGVRAIEAQGEEGKRAEGQGAMHARDSPRLPSEDARAARRPSFDLQAPTVDMRSTLTVRELQIVQLVCMGCLTKQIAARLHISEFTVRSYLKTIYCKLGVRCRAALVFSYMQACAGMADDGDG